MALSDIDAFMAHYARSDFQTKQISAKAPLPSASTSFPQRASAASNETSSSRQLPTQRNHRDVPLSSLASSTEHSVSSGAPLSPSRLARGSTARWLTVAEDSTGGCDQFLEFHKKQPRVGKYYFPTAEWEALKSRLQKQLKNSCGELKPSVPDFKGTSEVQKAPNFPFTFTSTYTSTTSNDTASLTPSPLRLFSSSHLPPPKQSLPHLLPKSICSQVKTQSHGVIESDALGSGPAPLSARNSKHVYLQPKLSSSPQAGSKLITPQIHSRPSIPSTLTEPQSVLQQILLQKASHQSPSQELAVSSSTSLPNTSSKSHHHVSPAMSNPQWNTSKGLKPSPMKVQDSNQKISTTASDPFKADSPQKVKMAQLSAVSNLPPHLRGGSLPPHLRGKPKDEDGASKESNTLNSRLPDAGLNVSVKADNPAAANVRVKSASQDPHSVSVKADEKLKVKDESRPTTSSGDWGGQSTLDTKLVDEIVLRDMKALQEIPNDAIVPLTDEAITKATGTPPRKAPKTLDFTDLVSAAGVSDVVSEDRPREGVRATQGRPAAEELLDWDMKTWMPPPVDWSDDRPGCNTIFINDFMTEWVENCAKFPLRVLDTTCEEFKTSLPAQADKFGEAIVQPDSEPDIQYSYDENKRLSQTSESSSKELRLKQQKTKVAKQANREDQEARNRETAQLALNPEPNPFAPAIEVYMRPATILDAAGIAEIYNYYVEKSNVPEDQAKISVDDAKAMVINAQNEQLPFIVAIRGKKPASHDKQGRPGVTNKATMPLYEAVVGFANAETFNYGFSGARNGRSRATTNLQLYVHVDFRRKGIGRNLLDRLSHILNPGYGYENACPWSNPGNSKVNEAGGSGNWHQMLFQLPVLGQNDPNYAAVKDFLHKKFLFAERTRLRAVARSSTVLGPAKFLDVVYFQAEAAPETDFDPFA